MKRLAIVAVFAACSTAHAQKPDPAPRPDGMAVVARADYDWALRTLDGDTTSLNAFRGRPLFINLWATWCAPCVAELASIERLRADPGAAGVAFLIVSPEEPDRVRAFLRRHGYTLPAYVERTAMPAAYGLRALPTTFLVDRNGDVVLRHRGAARWDDPAVVRLLRHLVDQERFSSEGTAPSQGAKGREAGREEWLVAEHTAGPGCDLRASPLRR